MWRHWLPPVVPNRLESQNMGRFRHLCKRDAGKALTKLETESLSHESLLSICSVAKFLLSPIVSCAPTPKQDPKIIFHLHAPSSVVFTPALISSGGQQLDEFTIKDFLCGWSPTGGKNEPVSWERCETQLWFAFLWWSSTLLSVCLVEKNQFSCHK